MTLNRTASFTLGPLLPRLARIARPCRLAALVVATHLAALAANASATVPTDLCSGNPCNVTGSITVDHASVLDFGSADLRFKSTANLVVGPRMGFGARTMTIRARSIVLEPGSQLRGGGDNALIVLEATDGAIELQASGSNYSRIDASSTVGPSTFGSGGEIDLTATGAVTVAGILNVSASGTDSSAGAIEIASGGAVTISKDVAFGASGTYSYAGSLTIYAATGVNSTAILDGAAPGSGGSADIYSDAGPVTLTKKVDLSGGSPDGSGGPLTIETTGDVSINQVLAPGGTGTDDQCGDGGAISVSTEGAVGMTGPINLNSGTECSGGTIDIVAGTTVDQGSTAAISMTGSFGGGEMNIEANGNVTLRAINMSGRDGGGALDLTTTAGLTTLAGTIDATGTGVDSTGGTIDIRGCSVTLESTGKLLTEGNFNFPSVGYNSIVAGGTLTVNGTMKAESRNSFTLRSGAAVVSGATIAPAATTTIDPSIPDCGSETGPVCGNGAVEDSEVCDDGNLRNCDGCTSLCNRIDGICGDGITECGEQCDDGNTEDGDGCESDCTLPGAAGVRFVGATISNGCFAQWELKMSQPIVNVNTGLPTIDQYCIDGDPNCDTDEANNSECSFQVKVCLRAVDSRIPNCSSAVQSVDFANLKSPGSLTSGAQVDRDNARILLDALEALGSTVKLAGTTLQSGPAIDGYDTCTAPVAVKVPRSATREGYKFFNIAGHDTRGLTMNSNQMRLHCSVNNAVCGNGLLEVTERCDDGNNASCDGCSADCKVESCGDGIIQCNEQCDDGALNGTSDTRCSAECTEIPPEGVRIPGGGSKVLDCGHEFSAEIDPAILSVDRNGVPKTLQNCTDNDPRCDLDPAVGACRIRLWSCLAGDDPRIGCTAAQVGGRSIIAPKSNAATAYELEARSAMDEALASIVNPAGAGERCSRRYEVNVPVNNRGLLLKPKVQYTGGNKIDTDTLKIRCRPAN